jgi:hypothetical protein
MRSRARAFCLNVLAAILQLVTFVVIVGWIWSILWGMTFIQLASKSSIDLHFDAFHESNEMLAHLPTVAFLSSHPSVEFCFRAPLKFSFGST